MGLADVVAVLKAETGDFTAKIDAAAVQLKGLSTSGESSMGKLSAALGSIPLPVVAVAAAVTVATVAVVDLAAKMETVDNKIAASAGISIASGKAIGDALLKASIGTTISGQEMGTAYASVAAQLGLTEGHALSYSQAAGVMKNANDLAEASGTDLGTATSALAGTMQAYGIKAAGAGLVTNDLYNTAKLTGNGIDTVSSTFAKLHSALGDVTPPISQVGGLMVDLAEHGETGRKAIGAVNTALTGIVTPTAAAAKAQAALGVSFFDASGKFEGMGTVISQLQPKLAGMSQEQQLATLKAIGFGSASKAMLDTILAGPAAYDAATAAVSKTGSAHEAAGKATEGLSESFKKIEVAAKDAGTLLGEKLLPVVESLAKDLDKFAIAVAKDWPEISNAFKVASDIIKGALEVTLAPIKALIEAIQGIVEFVKGVFTGNWSEAWDGIKKIFGSALDAIVAAPKAALDAIFSIFHTSWGKIGDDIHTAWSDIINFFTGIPGKIVTALGDVGSKLATWATTAWNAVTTAFTTAWNDTAKWFTGIWTKITTAIGDLAGDFTTWMTNAWHSVTNAFTSAWTATATWLQGLWGLITTAIGDLATDYYNWMHTAFERVKDAFTDA
jgi:TP901 family phage tail tape measure protein